MQKKPSPLCAIVVGAMLFSGAGNESAAASKLPIRSEIPAESRWSLEDIYLTDEAWEADFERLGKLGSQISYFQDKLDQSAATLVECLKIREEIGIVSGKLYAYSRMRRMKILQQQIPRHERRAESLLPQSEPPPLLLEPNILAMPLSIDLVSPNRTPANTLQLLLR